VSDFKTRLVLRRSSAGLATILVGMNHHAQCNRTEPHPEIDAQASAVIGAAVEVHRILGAGFLETIYEQAMCVELALRGLPFVRQAPVSVVYKNTIVAEARIDLLVADRLIVELKAVTELAPIHTAQVLSYLKAASLPLALLINFNVPVLLRGVRRIIHSS
jgi:GxxExxY protein